MTGRADYARGAASAADDGGPTLPQPTADHEGYVLGAVMLSPTALQEVAGMLTPDDFAHPRNAVVWEAALALHEAGTRVEALTVAHALGLAGDLTRAGGMTALHDHLATCETPSNAAWHAERVASAAVMRRLVQFGARAQQLGAEGEHSDAGAIVEAVRAEAQKIQVPTRSSSVRVGELLDPFLDRLERAADVDPDTGEALVEGLRWPYVGSYSPRPMQAGELIVIAGRPGQGKSTIGVDIARHCAYKQAKPALVFSLEMSRHELFRRQLAAECGVTLGHLDPGQADERDWQRINRKYADVAVAPLIIDDNRSANPAYIQQEATRIKRENGGLGVVVVDYLQLMSSGRQVASREQEIAGYTRALKKLAGVLECPVIAISQLNRGPEQRADKRPQVSDLRESGAIEQDADTVVLLHREDVYLPESPRAGEADLIFGKVRAGAPGTLTVASQLNRARFVSMAF